MRCRFLAVLILVAGSSPADAAESPELIVHHGKVVTVDPQFRIAEAFAIRAGRITAVGSNAEILQLAGPETKSIDVGGKTVIPGLIDSHVHPTGAAMYEFDHPIPTMETVGDVLQYVRSRAEASQPGDWINISQVFITRLRDRRYPTRKELDEAAPQNPVVFRTGPDAMLNSLALAASGIDRDFQITDGQSGLIEKDPQTGEPTGLLRNAGRLIKSKSSGKSASTDDQRGRLKALLADYNSVGLTSIADRNAGENALTQYESLRKAGDLSCRVFASYAVNGQLEWPAVEKQILKAAEHPLHQPDDLLWLRGVKVFLDGGMLTGSAYMRKPWGVSAIYSITDPEYQGLRFIPAEALERMARLALEKDLQFTAHSVGDGAVHALLDAYAAINRDLPVAPRRPCITHCNFMSPEAIAQMQELGVVADLQPAWLWLDGHTLREHFGDERLTWFQPYRSLFDAGVMVGGGSDHMQKIGSLRSVNPYNPFLGMWIAITRQPRAGGAPLHPEQKISREEALRLYTTNNAWVLFAEKDRGSLELGKLADFAILETDLLTCPEEAIKDIQVRATYLGGKVVYAAP